VDQSVTDYDLRELRKETAAAKAAVKAAGSIKLELETSTSHFVVRNIHPNAAEALREFASQVIARSGGAVRLSGPAPTLVTERDGNTCRH
jgi:hypothetical protein